MTLIAQKAKSRNKGQSNPFYGCTHSLEAREKMSRAHKGKKRPPRTAEWSRRISEAKKGTLQGAANHFFGKRHTETTKRTISQGHIANPIFRRFGEDHWNWQGGVTCANQEARNTQELKVWRRAVFCRDKFTCQQCGTKGCRQHPINAHHIKSFAEYPELRFDLGNGVTLCEDCHTNTRQEMPTDG
ncbi:hypothetical protein LCGC14_0567470 [marine sediment metagenome]|uniref:HNH nuclease domain-containing protein n=1 Tax=marine sediment metagenome TaxID=412755 RepID=A0A0F9RQD3_9ZZZZ